MPWWISWCGYRRYPGLMTRRRISEVPTKIVRVLRGTPSIPAVGQRGNDPDGSVRLNVAEAPEDSEPSGHSVAHSIAEPFDHAGFQSVTQMSRPVISNTRETIGLGRQTTRFPPSLITFRHAA